MVYTLFEVVEMKTAKLFMNGKSQAVRLPKEFRFEGDEVGIQKVGNTVYLFPKDEAESAWDNFKNLEPVSDDFVDAIFDVRNNYVQSVREEL